MKYCKITAIFLSAVLSFQSLILPSYAQEANVEPIREETTDSPNKTPEPTIETKEAGEIIHEGTLGTANWTISNDGVLTIGPGSYDQTGSSGMGPSSGEWVGVDWTPWADYKDMIVQVVGTEKFTAKGDYRNTFSNLSNAVKIDLSGWNVSEVSNFYSMFEGCTQLKELNLTGWNPVSAPHCIGCLQAVNNWIIWI